MNTKIATTVTNFVRTTCFAGLWALGAASPAAAQPVAPTGTAIPSAVAGAEEPTINWIGFGVRLGTTSWNLEADGLRETLREHFPEYGVGDSVSNQIQDMKGSMRFVIPTLHMGGEDFFFKLEAPIGSNATHTSFGFGVYPINYGLYLQSLRLFPYVTFGVAGHVMTAKDDGAAKGKLGAAGLKTESVGYLLQTRLAMGVKWRPWGAVSVSAELGYSPRSAGVLGHRRRR